MENKYGIVGVAHVGLPTNDLQKTVEFYKSLGFEEIMQTYNEKAGEKVAFLQIKNYCIETFENRQAAMSDGAYQHVALDVEDIESMYQKICNEKYTVIPPTPESKTAIDIIKVPTFFIKSVMI